MSCSAISPGTSGPACLLPSPSLPRDRAMAPGHDPPLSQPRRLRLVEPGLDGSGRRGSAATTDGVAEAFGQVVMGKRFEQRVEAHIPALRRYARALIRDADRAEDLLQDSLERALSRSHLFLPSGNLRAWLFRIMRNIYLNDLRTDSR